jgi:hypothetical protein
LGCFQVFGDLSLLGLAVGAADRLRRRAVEVNQGWFRESRAFVQTFYFVQAHFSQMQREVVELVGQ